MKRLLAGWLAASCGLMSIFLLGCPGSLDPGVGAGGMTGSADCQVALLASKCALSGCHAAGSNSAGLDLQSTGIGARLVDHDTAADTAGGMCAGMKLLNSTTNPATGVLIDKITLDDPCGSPMPLGGSLTAAEKTCLTEWATSLTGVAPFTGENRP